MTRNRRIEVKVPPDLHAQLKQAAHSQGFSSVNSLVRSAITNELRTGETALNRTEQSIAASIDRLAKEVRTLHTAQQALFAMTDSLARLFLTCVPEPPAEALDTAKRRARLRYDRFLLAVAQNMASDSRAALSELSDRAE